MIYLAKYRPLNSTVEGQRASVRFNIPPYVDGSCRREPDFQCEFPSISALCRGRIFAPRLKEGDEIVYITTKGFYGKEFKHWCIVARLKVLKRFDSHQDAAVWYQGKSRELPSNCMIAGNPPIPLNQTSRGVSRCPPRCGNRATTLKKWNAHYQKRADDFPAFLACKAVRKRLVSPAILRDKEAFKILKDWGRVLSRLPIPITPRELKALEKVTRFSRS